jgi:prepilin-type N-terminal cleavage/methylation domain-containing protein
MKDSQKGFTLIELLVVISIIGLLSSIVLAAVVDARAKAQGVVMAQNLYQLRNAMELYLTSNPTVPEENKGYYRENYHGSVSSNDFSVALQDLVNKKTISIIPISPGWLNNPNLSFGYVSLPTDSVTCGDTRWGRYTFYVSVKNSDPYNEKIAQASKLPQIYFGSSPYEDMYCITSP